MRGGEVLMECLLNEGVEVIWGISGGAVIEIYDALYFYRDRLPSILTRLEQGAGFAADGYARATGRPGVCLATSGPGATNLVTPITTAYGDSVPVVAITGQVATTAIGSDAFQEADTVGITLPVVKHSRLVMDVKDLPRTIHEAFHICQTGRPGPVLVDVPRDVSRDPVDSFELVNDLNLRSYKPAKRGHPLKVRQAAEEIANAKKPVLYVGGGVIHAGAHMEIRELADRCSLPTTYTLMAKGSFPDNHPLCLGMPGMHGTAYASLALNNSDLIICIGARFDDRITGDKSEFAKNARKIHVDIDPAEIGKNIAADVPIVGDAKTVTEQLLEVVKPKKDHQEWHKQINEWKEDYPLSYQRDGKLKPQYVLERLAKLTSGNAILTADVGQHQMWAAQLYPCHRPRQFINSGALGSMGYGFPAAMGAQVGCPNDTVIAIVGDGGFQMTLPELATCVEAKIPVKVLVLNNSFLGMVKQWQDFFFEGRYSGVEYTRNPDFVKLAEAYGAAGFRIENDSQVDDVLTKMLEVNDRPVVVDALIDPHEHVYPMIPSGKTIHDMILPPEQRATQREKLHSQRDAT